MVETDFFFQNWGVWMPHDRSYLRMRPSHAELADLSELYGSYLELCGFTRVMRSYPTL